MPTRLLREGILTSEAVDSLDAPAEVFYRRLMSKVDDHGLFDARPSILRASLFPLRTDRVREADISRWMAACQKAGLIVLYEADGKPFLCLLKTGWDKRSKPKYPLPPENICKQVLTDANTSTVVVVVDEVVNRFPDFWEIYPKKKSKGDAEKAWKAIKPNEQLVALILNAVEVAKTSEQWQSDGGKYIPYPASWLRAKGWEDDVESSRVKVDA